MNAPAELPIDRARFIGGSDAAAILGVSPWTTPLDLYLYKRGEKTDGIDPAREKLFRRGKRLEPVVIDMLIEELGIKVWKRSTPALPNRYADPLEPYLAAEIDFEWEVTPEIADRYDLPTELIGTIRNGEVKTVHPFASAKFGEAETDEIPVEYAAQAMHGLMVTGRQITLFGVLVGADNLTPYFIRRDEETIEGMRVQELAFWHEHVLLGVPPRPVNLPDVFQLFRRRVASRVSATPEIVDLVKELAALRNAEKTAKEGQEDLKFKIGRFMLGEEAVVREELPRGGLDHVRPTPATPEGVHELHVQGETVLQILMQNQRRIDTDKLREEHPEVAAACVHVVQSLKFQSTRKKGKSK